MKNTISTGMAKPERKEELIIPNIKVPELQAPAPPPAPKGKTLPPISTPETFRSGETGNVTGVRLPDGRFIFGTAKDVDAMINKSPTPAGTIEATQGAAQREQIAGAGAAIETAKTQQQPVQPAETKPINWMQAAGAGLGSAASGVIGGALVGGGWGAAVGGVGTAISGVRSNIATQISQTIKSGKGTLSELKTAESTAISAIKSGQDPAFWAEQFYLADTQIRQLAADSKKEEGRFLAGLTGKDATMALTEYEIYFSRTFPENERLLKQAALGSAVLPQNI